MTVKELVLNVQFMDDIRIVSQILDKNYIVCGEYKELCSLDTGTTIYGTEENNYDGTCITNYIPDDVLSKEVSSMFSRKSDENSDENILYIVVE